VTNWFGIVAPAKLPAVVLDAWSRTLRDALADADLRARMTELGMEILGGTPQDFQAMVDRDRARWSAVIASANITLE